MDGTSGGADVFSRVRSLVIERPFAALVGAVALLLFLDLLVGLATGRTAIADLATFVWDGVVIGLVVGVAAIGLSMTYSILRFANFSHGDLVTTGAFVGWMVSFLLAGYGQFELGQLLLVGGSTGINVLNLGINVIATPLATLVGLMAAALGTIAVALFIDRLVYRPMREHSGISLLIASVGVALALRYLIVFVYQSGTRGLTAAPPSIAIPVGSGSVNVDAHEFTLVVAALLMMVGVHFILQRTKLGKAMRAMADNKDLAQVTGIPTERVVRSTWLIGGGLTGAAGYLVALERGTIAFNLGWVLLLLIFAAVILGGIGSVYGAMIGGLLIGLTSTVSLVWLPSDFSHAAAFAVMIFVLLFKPEGLYGGVSTA